MPGQEWHEPEAVARWLETRRRLAPAEEAEAVIMDYLLPATLGRVLDLGTGDGHLIAAVLERRPTATGVGLDVSVRLLELARARFDDASQVALRGHDLMDPLPADVGRFDAAVSGLAIHHLADDRKRSLFGEVCSLLLPGGVFCVLDVVASPTPELHERAQAALGFGPEDQHRSDQPARLDEQLLWLRQAGFDHVDCFWKWFELAVFAGTKPDQTP
jgi:SAM-dependent methyltransferase